MAEMRVTSKDLVRETVVPAIPTIPEKNELASILRAVKQLLETREGLRGSPLDANITWRELLDRGMVNITRDGSIGGGGGDVGDPDTPGTVTIPPAPTGLTATGAMTSIILEWANPVAAYANHSYTKIYRNAVDNLATATLIGLSPGRFYTDAVGSDAAYYYWVRFVSNSDTEGPPNATAGTLGETSPDVAYLLEMLSGQITESELYAALSARIDLIDAAEIVPGSVNARIKTETDARVSGDSALASQISSLAVSSDAGFDFAKIWYFDASVDGWTSNGGSPTVSTGWLRPYAHATDPQLISPAALAVSASTYASVKCRIRRVGSPGTWAGELWWKRAGDGTWDAGRSMSVAEPTWDAGVASITWEVTDADWSGTIDQIRLDLSTLSDGSNYYELDWVSVGRSAPGASTAQVSEIETARIGYCMVGGYVSTHGDRTACLAAGGTWYIGLPWATAVKQVAVTDALGTAALETKMQAYRSNLGVLNATYTVKLDVGGVVSGFGLSANSDGTANGTTSAFAVRAGSFYVAPPHGSGLNQIVPFTVQTTTIPAANGVPQIDPGVYIQDAFIKNGAITNAKIGAAAIDDAKIANLSATKITSGTINSDLLDTTTLVARLAQVNTAYVNNANIGSFIQSTVYGPQAGWRIDKDGTAVFNNITIRDSAGNTLLSSGTGIDLNSVNNKKEFTESFDSVGRWVRVLGTGEASILPVADAIFSSNVLRIGDNAGNDTAWYEHPVSIPFDPTTLYRIRVRVRRVQGTGTFFAGVTAIDSNGERVNTVGQLSISSQHYVAAAGASPTSDWTEYEGYFEGRGVAQAETGTNTAAAPYKLHPNARAFRPMFIVNYDGVPGVYDLDMFTIESVSGAMGTLRRLTQGTAGTFIEDAAIASAKIAELTADKISSGTIKVGTYIQSSNYEPGVPNAGWAMNYLGQAEFNDVYVRGTMASSVVLTTFLQNDITVGQPGSSFMDLRANTPTGWMLYKRRSDGRELGILGSGETRFANSLAGLNWFPLGVLLDSAAEAPYEFAIDTGLSSESYVVDTVITPALSWGGMSINSAFPYYYQPTAQRGWLDFTWRSGARQVLYSNDAGYPDVAYSNARRPPTLIIHGTLRLQAPGNSMTGTVGGIYWSVFRIT